MVILDRFFGGAFFTYGIEVMDFSERAQEDRFDPMIFIFPRMTKCTFHKFGASGEIEKYDGLCVLPLNVINEKLYIIIWFWFVGLGLISAIVFVARILTLMSTSVRVHFMSKRFPHVQKDHIESVVSYCGFGGWFMLHLLGTNLEHGVSILGFPEIMKHLHAVFSKQNKHTRDYGDDLPFSKVLGVQKEEDTSGSRSELVHQKDS